MDYQQLGGLRPAVVILPLRKGTSGPARMPAKPWFQAYPTARALNGPVFRNATPVAASSAWRRRGAPTAVYSPIGMWRPQSPVCGRIVQDMQ